MVELWNWRPCRNYRALNVTNVPDRYSPSEYPGLHGQPAGIHCPLEGGLTKAYDEITVAEEDTCKTAVTIPFVFYEFTHIPIGL